MDPVEIIEKYYYDSPSLKHILFKHSEAVTEMALAIASNHPELKADTKFISEAAMIHDIGIIKTMAPKIHCFGEHPYICHGYLGRELIEKEGFPLHALVCERHTGTGLSKLDIKEQDLPLPLRDMNPITIEERIICFADTFFSKTRELTKPKSLEQIRNSLSAHGENQIDQFNYWCELFL
ncbi:MAG: HDIG domain-containing protein [Bacteroidota bacterium]|nr:HDIG domain-containing protein [Bacteroidota bacterium]MDP4206209.1 HDIG domain-containing protein [Bacteroidota bacterium]